MTAVPPGWTPEPARKRLDAATPGPWIHDGGAMVYTKAVERYPRVDICMASWHPANNAAFIAHAPTDIAALLALVDEAREALRPYVENAAPHEQLWNGEDFRNFQRAEAFLARFAADKDST